MFVCLFVPWPLLSYSWGLYGISTRVSSRPIRLTKSRTELADLPQKHAAPRLFMSGRNWRSLLDGAMTFHVLLDNSLILHLTCHQLQLAVSEMPPPAQPRHFLPSWLQMSKSELSSDYLHKDWSACPSGHFCIHQLVFVFKPLLKTIQCGRKLKSPPSVSHLKC